VAGPAPLLGADTDDVLAELGLADTDHAETTVYDGNRANFIRNRSVGAATSDQAAESV
jgi:hypothetical protein